MPERDVDGPAGRPRPARPARCRRTRPTLIALSVVSMAIAGCTADQGSAPTSTSGTGSQVAAGMTTAEASSDSPTPAGPAPSPAYAATVSPAIEQVMREDGTPGAVVVVRSAAGDWTSAFGVRAAGNPQPTQTGDVFRLANVTSALTATVILQLEEQGLLSQDDPVSKYVDGVPNGDQITLRALGRYRSGLFDFEQDETFQARYAEDPARSWKPQEVLDLAFAHPAEAPGTESYSTTNFVLLGLVIEKVTGAPAAQAFGTGLFQPLALTRIGLAGDATLPDPHADGHSWVTNPFADPILPADQRKAAAAGTLAPINRTADNPGWAFTAGAGYSDAASLADLFAGITTGSLLDADSQARRTAGMNSLRPANGVDSVQYGFGISKYGQYLFYSGTMPGYSAFAAISPDTGTTIVVLTNLDSAPDGASPVGSIFHAIAETVEPVDLPGS